MDQDAFAGEIILTFDGDAAGQAAATDVCGGSVLRPRVHSSLSAERDDPCVLRLAQGDPAVRDLIALRAP